MIGPDVAVVGGGAIGLAVAWRAALGGLAVAVVDDDPGRAASRVAAGMLAPVTEVHHGEERLLALNLASARRWPSFAAELEAASGCPVGYRDDGTVVAALTTDDHRALLDLHDFQCSLGLDVERLRSRECRALEPMLAPGVRGGLLVAGDHSVDNRLLVAALAAAAAAAGVDVRRRRAIGVVVEGGRAVGVDLGDGEVLAAGTVVLAAGSWSGQLAGLPPEVVPPVRPVKGQLLRLRGPADDPLLTRTVRGLVLGSPIYLVPRADGQVVVGATMEERGEDRAVTAGAVHDLLRDAVALVPGVAELELEEACAGSRPGTPDNAPLLGPTALDGLVAATGHFRNGILLTPTTADAIAELLATGRVPDLLAPFDPTRFTSAAGALDRAGALGEEPAWT